MTISLTQTIDRYCRIYSGNSPTPFFVTLFQIDQPDIPMMEPRSDYTIQPDMGRVTDKAGSYLNSQLTPFEPIPFSIMLTSTPEYRELLTSLGNIRRKPTWTVGGDTWQPVAKTALGTRIDGRGNAQACVAPPDWVQLQYMVNFVWTEQSPPDAIGGESIYGECRGLVINTCQASANGELISYNIEGYFCGSINSNLSAWPTGTESFPS